MSCAWPGRSSGDESLFDRPNRVRLFTRSGSNRKKPLLIPQNPPIPRRFVLEPTDFADLATCSGTSSGGVRLVLPWSTNGRRESSARVVFTRWLSVLPAEGISLRPCLWRIRLCNASHLYFQAPSVRHLRKSSKTDGCGGPSHPLAFAPCVRITRCSRFESRRTWPGRRRACPPPERCKGIGGWMISHCATARPLV